MLAVNGNEDEVDQDDDQAHVSADTEGPREDSEDERSSSPRRVLDIPKAMKDLWLKPEVSTHKSAKAPNETIIARRRTGNHVQLIYLVRTTDTKSSAAAVCEWDLERDIDRRSIEKWRKETDTALMTEEIVDFGSKLSKNYNIFIIRVGDPNVDLLAGREEEWENIQLPTRFSSRKKE